MQVEFAEKYADLHKLDIYCWYKDDGISGVIPLHERESGAKLLEDARNKKIDLLLLYKLDRLGRTARVILNAVHELEENGIVVRSMTEPFDTGNPNGRFLLTVLAAVADLDRETTLERLWHGTNRAARKGKWLGGIVPYGYKVNEEGFLEVNETIIPGINLSEANVVRLIYRLICEHKYTTIQVADYLNALHVPTSYVNHGRKVLKGKRKVNTSGYWHPGRISHMIANTVYKGVHHYGQRTNKEREIITRTVPAIVSEETWEQARQVMRENRLECFNRRVGNKYLLRGLIKCRKCGSRYHGVSYSKKSRRDAYYVCNGKGKYWPPDKEKCTAKNIPQQWIEDLVWNDCVSFITNPGDLIYELSLTVEQEEDRREELEREKKAILSDIDKKEIERERVINLYRKNIIREAVVC